MFVEASELISRVEAIEGWLFPHAIALTTRIVQYQNSNGWTSGILELGVFKGKYLALLAGLTADQGCSVVGVDAFLERVGVKLQDHHREYAMGAIQTAIETATGSESRAVLLPGYTREIDPETLRRHAPEGFSFVSLDAGHEAEDLLCDCAIVDRVLAPNGVVAFDDVFNSVTPGVAEGFFRYFGEHPYADFAPFATGGNKVFACRGARYQEYLELAHEISARAAERDPCLVNTTAHVAANVANAWTPRLLGREIVPFV